LLFFSSHPDLVVTLCPGRAKVKMSSSEFT